GWNAGTATQPVPGKRPPADGLPAAASLHGPAGDTPERRDALPLLVPASSPPWAGTYQDDLGSGTQKPAALGRADHVPRVFRAGLVFIRPDTPVAAGDTRVLVNPKGAGTSRAATEARRRVWRPGPGFQANGDPGSEHAGKPETAAERRVARAALAAGPAAHRSRPRRTKSR